MKRFSVLAAIAFLSAAASVTAASADGGRICHCRANGADYEVDQVACIRIGSESFMARCEMVLNNTSWKRLSNGCPLSSLPGSSPALSLAASSPSADVMCEPARLLGRTGYAKGS